MSLLSFQEGHKAEEAADWHCSGCAFGHHTQPCCRSGSHLALTLFLLQGDQDFLENQGQGSLGELQQTPGFFPLLKKIKKGNGSLCLCWDITHCQCLGLVLDVPCCRCKERFIQGKARDTKPPPLAVSRSAFSHCSQVALVTFLGEEETSLIFKHSQPCICCYLLDSFWFSQHYPVFQVTLVFV